MMKTLVILACLGMAAASCPNKCSGHGTCGANDKCTCFRNYQAADCSQRVCSYGRAWNDVASANDVAHAYAECSNRGTCDRDLGQCECFDGYTGAGCARQVCPNDCSGKGVCEPVNELSADRDLAHEGAVRRSAEGVWAKESGVSSVSYDGWDGEVSRACVCDAGYEGVDCSQRMCPRGDDPLTCEVDITLTKTTSLQVDEVQNVSVVASTHPGSGLPYNMNGGEVTFTYTDVYNGKWTTRPVALPAVKTWGNANAKISMRPGSYDPVPGMVLQTAAEKRTVWGAPTALASSTGVPAYQIKLMSPGHVFRPVTIVEVAKEEHLAAADHVGSYAGVTLTQQFVFEPGFGGYTAGIKAGDVVTYFAKTADKQDNMVVNTQYILLPGDGPNKFRIALKSAPTVPIVLVAEGIKDLVHIFKKEIPDPTFKDGVAVKFYANSKTALSKDGSTISDGTTFYLKQGSEVNQFFLESTIGAGPVVLAGGAAVSTTNWGSYLQLASQEMTTKDATGSFYKLDIKRGPTITAFDVNAASTITLGNAETTNAGSHGTTGAWAIDIGDNFQIFGIDTTISEAVNGADDTDGMMLNGMGCTAATAIASAVQCSASQLNTHGEADVWHGAGATIGAGGAAVSQLAMGMKKGDWIMLTTLAGDASNNDAETTCHLKLHEDFHPLYDFLKIAADPLATPCRASGATAHVYVQWSQIGGNGAGSAIPDFDKTSGVGSSNAHPTDVAHNSGVSTWVVGAPAFVQARGATAITLANVFTKDGWTQLNAVTTSATFGLNGDHTTAIATASTGQDGNGITVIKHGVKSLSGTTLTFWGGVLNLAKANQHLLPGTWVRIHSTALDGGKLYCDMQVVVQTADNVVTVLESSKTSVHSTRADGKNSLCADFDDSSSTGISYIDGDGDARTITQYGGRIGALALFSHVAGTLTTTAGAGTQSDNFFAVTAAGLVSRDDTDTSTDKDYVVSEIAALQPGALVRFFTTTGVTCSGIVTAAPADTTVNTFTVRDCTSTETVAGVTQTSCMGQANTRMHMAINSGNSLRFTGADSNNADKFTGVAAGDALLLSGANYGTTVSNGIDSQDSVRMPVGRVYTSSSVTEAIYFKVGSAPNGGGMYPAIGHHLAVTLAAAAKGTVFPRNAYTEFAATARTSNKVTQGTVATDILPVSAIVQSAYTGACAWCATDAATTASAADVKRVVMELPNQAVESATVAMNANSLGAYGYTVTFGTGNSGDQKNIVMNVGGCDADGCQPRYTGVRLQQVQQLALADFTTNNIYGSQRGASMLTDAACSSTGGDKLTVFGAENNDKTFTTTGCTDATGHAIVETATAGADKQVTVVRTVALGDLDTTSGPATNAGTTEQSKTYFNAVTTEITRGTKESSECGGRGLCDGETGQCTCHEGYTGAACELQTVLF